MENTSWVMPTHIVAGAGIVINDNDEILMVKTYNAGWVFPGGQVEVGENIIDAVKREIMEETGIEVEVGELFCISSNTRKHPGTNGVKCPLRSCWTLYAGQKAGRQDRPMRIRNPRMSRKRKRWN